ncbi:MAG: hypothetical protein MJE77_39515 [Proteobacteria bacterium]|nr:hypothetical protein [Pseudomonadota bacterium]
MELAPLAVLALACAGVQGPLHTHTRPITIKLAGQGTLQDSGALRFLLEDQLVCEQVTIEVHCRETKTSICGKTVRKQQVRFPANCDTTVDTLVATPPWQSAAITASVASDRTAVFAIDWKAAEFAANDPELHNKLRAPWTITGDNISSPITWSPSDRDIEIILKLIGKTPESDARPAPVDDRPAELAVRSLVAEGGGLTAGQDNRLVVTVHNKGPGTAPNVTAKTRSSNAQLHNLEFVLGNIAAGKDKSRSVEITLKKSPKETRATVVLFVHTRRKPNAAEYTKQLAIARTPREPKLPELTLACKLERHVAGRELFVHPGQELSIWCQVGNRGRASATGVQVTVRAGKNSSNVAIKRRIRRKKTAGVRIPLRVPNGARIGQSFDITASATAARVSQDVVHTIRVTVRKPSRCPGGLLSREQYEQKRSKLEKLRGKGLMSQDEFDKYDAELVACIE